MIKSFEITPGHHCFYASIWNLLRYYQINISEQDIFFMMGFHIHLDACQNKETQHKNMLCFDTFEVLFERIASRLDCAPQMQIIESKEDFSKYVTDNVSLGVPVILCVDPYILEYQTVQTNLSNLHYVLITDYDCQKETVLLHDAYVLDIEGNVKTFSGVYDVSRLYSKTINCMWFESPMHNITITNDTILTDAKNLIRSFIYDSTKHNAIEGNRAIQIFMNCYQEKISQGNFFSVDQCIQIILFVKAKLFPLFQYTAEFLRYNYYKEEEEGPAIILSLKELENKWAEIIKLLLIVNYKQTDVLIQKLLIEANYVIKKQQQVYEMIYSFWNSLDKL